MFIFHIFAVKLFFLWLCAYVVYGISGASLKLMLNKVLHKLFCRLSEHANIVTSIIFLLACNIEHTADGIIFQITVTNEAFVVVVVS